MKDSEKSKEELLSEIRRLRKQLASKAIFDSVEPDSYGLCDALLRSSKLGIVIINDDKVVFANGIVDYLFGTSTEKLVGCDIERLFKYIAPDNRGKVRDAYYKYKDVDEFTFEYDFKIIDSGGDSRWLGINARSIQFQGKLSVLAMLLEITKRKNAEIELLESRQRLELSIESSGLAVWDQNFQTGEVIRSSQWAEMLGYNAEEIGDLLDDWKNLVHPDDLPKVIEIARQHESGAKPEFNVEHRMKAKNGEWRWISNRGKIITRDIRGNPIRALGTHLDITEQKINEKIREQSEQFLRDIIDSIEVDIIIRDRNAKILYAGKAFAEYFNYKVDEIIGINNTILWERNGRSPETVKAWLDEDMQVLDTGLPLDYEEETDNANGEVKCYRTIKKKIYTPDGIPAVLVIYENITERKRSEKELLDNQRRLRLMAESIEDIFWMSVPDLSRHVYVSPVIAKVWQQPFARFLENPKYYMRSIHPDDRKKYDSLLKQTHYQGKSYEVEYRILREDGSIRWILDRAFPVTGPDGKVEFMAGLSSDITKRKRAERGLIASHEILRLANKHYKMKSLLDEVVESLKKLTGCEAVSVRLLDEDGQSPYRSYTGFTGEFDELQCPLSVPHEKCMCIDIIREIHDPDESCHTENGSFYLNNISKHIARMVEEDKNQPRIGCNKYGYESVALIPIKVDRKIIGLIHCADRRENNVPLDMVKILEQLATQFGAIIERVKAGEALRESEEQFRNLVESMNDGLLVSDSNLRFTYINEKMADLLKVNPADLIRRNIEDFLDSRNKNILRENWEKRKKGGVTPYQLTWRAVDNRSVVTIISPKPMWGQNNEFRGSFSVVTDITERNQEELINKAKSKLADKLRNTGEVQECLKAACKALAEAELLKHSVFILVDNDRKISHLDYLGVGQKDIILMKKELPELIKKISGRSNSLSRISNSYLISSSNGHNSERLLTPISNQIVDHTGWLIADTTFSGKRINHKSALFIEDIAEYTGKRINEILFLGHLQRERQLLEEKNVALREVLASIEEEKMEIRHKVAQRIDQMVIPTLNKMVNNDGTVNHTYYDLLSSSIRELAASSGGLMHLYSRLSPREVEICNLIKGGSSSKEVAKALNLSVATIQKHRERIRHKLGLANKNVNLTSFLKNPG